jgi:hypothetical protein
MSPGWRRAWLCRSNMVVVQLALQGTHLGNLSAALEQ